MLDEKQQRGMGKVKALSRYK